MVPFLSEELKEVVTSLLTRFVKKEVLGKVNTVSKLAKLDPIDKQLHVVPTRVGLGFSAKRSLRLAIEEKRLVN